MTDNTLELTNGQIVDIAQALAEVSRKEFPVKTTYWIGRIAAKLDSTYNQIMKLNDNLIISNSGGQRNITPEHENWTKFLQEREELMEIKESIDFNPVNIPLTVPEKVNGKEVTLSLNTMLILDKLIRIEGIESLTKVLPEV